MAKNGCTECGKKGHNRRSHRGDLSASEEAGRLVHEQGLSFAEAARRTQISRQAAHQGLKRYLSKKKR
jgi:predicted DNA-binding protein (UPF0251 family)